MKVRNVMMKDVKFCPPEATLADVAKLMARNDCGWFRSSTRKSGLSA